MLDSYWIQGNEMRSLRGNKVLMELGILVNHLALYAFDFKPFRREYPRVVCGACLLAPPPPPPHAPLSPSIYWYSWFPLLGLTIPTQALQIVQWSHELYKENALRG